MGVQLMFRCRCFSHGAQPFRALLAAAVYLAFASSCRAGIVLYDDATMQLPQDQAWLTYAASGLVTQSVVAGTGVRLTTSDAVAAGYSNRNLLGTLKNPGFPSLDRNSGFSLDFELQIHAESHTSADRAGFSAIVLADDGMGIELGFWQDQVWAQSASPLFTHAESANFDTTAAEVAWSLSILGNTYALFGDSALVLSGSLRNYSAVGIPPYTGSNFLFLGDNTTNASADFTLGSVSISAVPEPSTFFMASLVCCLLGRRRSHGKLRSHASTELVASP
ncbi:MAG: hypothetical protein KDA91_14180 [Planctomycetaceae bacterium]|nr:hypothetical protein [Planctomycetaceae bacterium]